MKRASAACLALLLCGLAAHGVIGATISLAQVVEVCGSKSVAEASAKAAARQWRPMQAGRLDEWRTAFVSYNGGSVEVTGWRSGESGEADTLSFWIARGPNGHKACAFASRRTGADFLEALTRRFGPPASLDTLDFGATAFWKTAEMEVSYSRIGTATSLNILDLSH